MTVYSYRATTRDGLITEGAIDATDEKLAVSKLISTGVIPLKVLPIGKGKGERRTGLRSARGDLQTFTGELSVLLNAGLPLDRSLSILSTVFEKKRIQGAILSILKSIREGKSLSDALQDHPSIFPRLYVNMIRAGEAGGVLHTVLEKLSEYLETSKELKDHVLSAMIYPAILVGTGAASIIIMIMFVIPRFSVIFEELGSALPLPTKILLSASSVLQSCWWLLITAPALLFFMLKHYIKSEAGRYCWDRFKLKFFRNIIVKLETARFCRTLGTSLKSGVPLLQALNNARDVIGNQVIAYSLDYASKGVKEGKGMAATLSDINIFPSLAVSMIKVGEETGQMDDMLLKVAVVYEKNLRETIKRFVSMLEPVMILTMGLIIGFIVISILMAIFSITDLPM